MLELRDFSVRIRLGSMATQLRDLAARDARRRLTIAPPSVVTRSGKPWGRKLRHPNAEYYHGVKRAWARRVSGEEPDGVWEEPPAILEDR